jgi:hypothetical protein
MIALRWQLGHRWAPTVGEENSFLVSYKYLVSSTDSLAKEKG